MDKQKLKNQKYYAANKDKIAEKLYKKETCECCNRTVSHQNMVKHKRSGLCRKSQENNEHLGRLKELKEKYHEQDDELESALDDVIFKANIQCVLSRK